MLVLGIETSCDETAAAVVEDGHRLLANVVASQEEIHARYGGIVPEVASRQHLLSIATVVETALARAPARWEEIAAIAVTHGPGLAGSLLVGLNFAKAVALARGIPLVAVNHLEGHIYSAWLDAPAPRFPLLCLLVSGGHTGLFLMEDHGHYRQLGGTRDDAAGEAFDKVARLLGLGFPGGPAIQRVAAASAGDLRLPRAWLPGTDDFSFSGLKTAALHLVQKLEAGGAALPVPEVAAAFQEAVVDVLAAKAAEAARATGARELLLGGGVAANLLLRDAVATRSPVPVRVPPVSLCTDNGAMIAAAGFFRWRAGERAPWDLDVHPSLRLG
ncbi:MAG: tRNA (adenosine(37)-N6)-threonylcarbamoyltransferase complex transferase subunit TsaD [Chloroflexi bacterium]|nr:tRNA (adenosine(37)-N6)-threonylcarbamoyltransferase complex transferase subunit TsaD [Chloroflexota bacterium]